MSLEFLGIVAGFALPPPTTETSQNQSQTKVLDGEYIDPFVLAWATSLILRKTICLYDESVRHVYASFESKHPYDATHHKPVLVELPFAKSLRFSFDSRCELDNPNDCLSLYAGDVDNEQDAKISKSKMEIIRYESQKNNG